MFVVSYILQHVFIIFRFIPITCIISLLIPILKWSRNIKRAIISAFQIKSQNDLRDLESQQKSATVYETDILGRCRTTYKLEQQTDTKFKLNKMKSLQRCTLNENLKASAIQYVPYKTLPVR